MARIKYRPSTRTRAFDPIQISQQGITEMRRNSDRVIRGLQSNLNAEKEQQARERAALEQSAEFDEEKIRRNRQIEEQNLRNEQLSLSQQAKEDEKQLQYDADAQKIFLDTFVDFSKTIAAKAAENHAKMVKDQTEAGKIANIDEYREQWNELKAKRAQLAIQSDVDTVEYGVENQEPLVKTMQGILANNGRGDIQNEIIMNRLITETFDSEVEKALLSPEQIYTDKQGRKFSGLDANGDRELNRIVTSTVHDNLIKDLGLDTAVEGYLDRSSKVIEDKKKALSDRAGGIQLNRYRDAALFQAETLYSGREAEDYIQGYQLLEKSHGRAFAHEFHRKMYEDGSHDINELNRMGTFLEGGKPYDQGRWKDQLTPHLRARMNNETKKISAEKRFKEAQLYQFEVENVDTIRQAYRENFEQAREATLKRYHDMGLAPSELIKSIERTELKRLEQSERDMLLEKIKFSQLDEAFINNNIEYDGNKSIAKQALQELEKEKYGAPLKEVKRGYEDVVKDLLNIDVGSNTANSHRARMMLNEILKVHAKRYKRTKNYDGTVLSIIEGDVLKAKAGDTSGFLTGTPATTGGITIYPWEKDAKARNAQRTAQFDYLDTLMAKHGSDVQHYAANVSTQAEIDLTISSAQQGKVIFSKGLIYLRDRLNEANPDKPPLQLTELFNELQKARAKYKFPGRSYPLLEPTRETEALEVLTPANLKLQQLSRENRSSWQAQRAVINTLTNVDNGQRLRNSTRRSMPGGNLNSQRQALEIAAADLGVDPIDLATIIGFETAGTYDPGVVGGEGNNYQGLIQFGIPERQAYGVVPGMSFEEQLLGPVVSYFKDRFAKVGMSTQGATLEDLYTTVLAGNPKANRDAADSFGTTARSGAKRMFQEHRPVAMARFGFN